MKPVYAGLRLGERGMGFGRGFKEFLDRLMLNAGVVDLFEIWKCEVALGGL